MTDGVFSYPPSALLIWKQREGLRLRMYADTKGIATIGYGHNLRDVPISRRAADVICEDDVEAIAHQVAGVVGDAVWASLCEARQAAFIDMGAMGPGKLASFHDMLAAVYRNDWNAAADAAVASQWYRDVGKSRGDEVAAMLRTGELPDWVKSDMAAA